MRKDNPRSRWPHRLKCAVSAIALWLGLLGLLAVFCFLFPGPLSTPEMRVHYPMEFLRGLTQGGLLVGLALGLTGLFFATQRLRSAIAVLLAGAALALGGGYAQPWGDTLDAPVIGLDFLVLDLFALCLLFVPLERALGKPQPVLRRGWRVDLVHFGVCHALVGLIAAASVVPAHVLFSWALDFEFRQQIAAWNPVVQFVLVVLVVDFTCYWLHRAFHAVPFLWRFHAVHHSIEHMDWLAGSRQHLGDILVTRAAGFVPVFVLGFADVAVYAYILLISFHAVFIHANARVGLGWFGRVLTSPRYHHWHHTDQAGLLDKNFAVLLPVWDVLFGTALWRKDWPESYGLSGDGMPESWLGQLIAPLRRQRQ
ncbi:MAG: sterol desaturase family protein [Planctomycetes bacterium]|nr:sterol desaturase family protein [Planctomycetota bacterium]